MPYNGRRVAARLVPVLLGASLCLACATDPATATSDLIDGEAADEAAFDAVGALADGGNVYCTATLISSTAVLTAKHCVSQRREPNVTFLIGPDSRQPRREVAIVAAAALAPDLDAPGAGGYGYDVAVYELAEAVTDIAPLPFAPSLTEADVGVTLLAVGYGSRGTRNSSGVRQKGGVTLRLIEGRPCDVAFASYDAFKTYATNAMGLFPGEARTLCDTPLVDQGEVWVGGGGEAQSCVGDSGGPLLIERDGEHAIAGVASWVYRSKYGVCHKGGGAYAVFPDEVQPLLDDHR